jgi:proline dehydrogenase
MRRTHIYNRALMPLFENLVLRTLPYVPRPILWRVAKRYVAGERLDDAIKTLVELRERQHSGIIDVLGEEVESEAQARMVLEEYKLAADAVVKAHVDAYVSVKPTHVGLRTSEALCLELYHELAAYCAVRKLFLRVEMEDHTTTDATLRVFEALRRDFANVGIVLQSRLKRTLGDIAKLAPGSLNVRLVKGIYLEPAEIAHVDPEPIRAAYVDCVRALLARNASISLATHDERMAAQCLALIAEHAAQKPAYELQVLMGVMEHLWARWKHAGHPVRVYVPFGPQWQPYSLRRLRKNPQMLRHVIRAALGLSRFS